MKNLKILITAGPTREYIDAVRFISNPSSGKMGIALAEKALSCGADVTIVYGNGTALPPAKAKVINVETTHEMCDAVINELKNEKYDVLIAAAACADYRASEKKDCKIPSKQENLVINLKPTPKIIEEVKKVLPDIFLCAFKAEYNLSNEELIEKAYERLKEVGFDLIIANDIGKPGSGFTTDTNEVYIVNKNKKVVHVPLNSKHNVAGVILETIIKNYVKL